MVIFEKMRTKIKEIRETASNSAFLNTLLHTKNFLIANFFFVGIGIITIPIFTKLLTTNEYGLLNLYDSTFKIIGLTFTFCIEVAIIRYYLEEKEDFDEFLETAFSLIFLAICGNIFFILLVLPFLSNWINLSIFLILLGMISSSFLAFHKIYIAIIQVQLRSKEFLLIGILNSLFTVSLSIVLTLILIDNRHFGQIGGRLIVTILFGFYFIYKLRKKISLSFRKKHFEYILLFSSPIFLQVLGIAILKNIDKLLISTFLENSSLGIYSVAANISILIILVFESLNNASDPKIVDFLNKGNFAEADILAKRILSVLAIFLLGFSYFMDLIYFILVDPKFHEGIFLTVPLLIGYYFFIKGKLYQRYFRFNKKTYYIAFNSLFVCLISILLNIIFIPMYGLLAAAIVSALSFIIFYILNWVFCKIFVEIPVHPVPLFWKKTIPLFAFILIGIYISNSMNNAFILFISKIILLLVFSLLIFSKDLLNIIKTTN